MDRKNIITNKKAFFEYEVLETYEAGIQLLGTEVKSIRDGRCNIAESYVIEDNNELFIKSLNISPYKNGNINNHDPLRKRKILLHRKEISKIIRAVKEKGITVIPIKIYLLGSLIKVEIAICRGKKLYDKREAIKEKDNKKNIQRELRSKL
ncbi:MAG TPA: SsrA-binding protein SmpB [Spirochaetota bacterium]|jgi:SsrA-binding protein|nr:MAG: SsrA-binding protein [Spirochaetes bacterium ADurb.Bin133]HNZ27216.1 SsrA-binding protein SmpB [Spirochaetota bacterium]HOF01101.1 SsrA-binding protein SmpB [Spirochaetota bacterium]HOS33966.1 SsrA-binding protein SmpB [Spirochaetota bacterium]HOS55341.1 SsrA-binding protein SmpB [Spirochaetota bacterium]